MGQISSLHAGLRTLILAHPYFSDVPVISIEEKDFNSEIEQAIGRLGVCVSLMTPRTNVPSPNIPGPYFDLFIDAYVGENVLLNRYGGGTGKKASDIAEAVLAAGHLQYYDLQTEALLAVGCELVDKTDDELIWKASFKTSGGVGISGLPAVVTPGITDDGAGGITLTCATGGAAMFYTTNGSFPSPRNGTLYTAPFIVASGTQVRVSGWLAGYSVSAVAQYSRP